MPGAIVIGDYVIERNDPGISREYDEDDFLENAIFRFPAYGGSWNGPRFSAIVLKGIMTLSMRNIYAGCELELQLHLEA
ncbi:UNVERIFIED_CONTAM: hypothetical protein Sradi_3475300 [Sesamum radiatum]|uniref:Uncharacterized protein n=1 Tax=Sesamum radiatum TaxID=300843 RepID=A0AAW2QE28_SESRA